MSKKKYEDMSFEELQEVYRAAVATREEAARRIEDLEADIVDAGEKYKSLQAELRKIEADRCCEGGFPEEDIILEEIGKRIFAGKPEDPEEEPEEEPEGEPEEEPAAEKKPVRRTRRNRADNDS